MSRRSRRSAIPRSRAVAAPLPRTVAKARPARPARARPRFIGIGLVAIAALVGISLVIVSAFSGGSPTKAPASLGAPHTTLLSGIPQHGIALGSPRAPVTLVEFADLQCPFCGAFAREAMPTVVRTYVRTGKVRVVFQGLEFVGSDSDTALRAVLAASLQNHGWEMVDALYGAQGMENSGWVTTDLLRRLGNRVRGLDTTRMLHDATGSAAVERSIRSANALAQTFHVNGTPTFFVGRTGGKLRRVTLAALTAQALRPSIDALLGS